MMTRELGLDIGWSQGTYEHHDFELCWESPTYGPILTYVDFRKHIGSGVSNFCRFFLKKHIGSGVSKKRPGRYEYRGGDTPEAVASTTVVRSSCDSRHMINSSSFGFVPSIFLYFRSPSLPLFSFLKGSPYVGDSNLWTHSHIWGVSPTYDLWNYGQT
jgi:hypothetical protein